MTSDLTERMREFLASPASKGLSKHRFCGPSGLYGTNQYKFTWAVSANIEPIGHARRYRYLRTAEAVVALDVWGGAEHSSRPWIECKGANGELLSAKHKDWPSP